MRTERFRDMAAVKAEKIRLANALDERRIAFRSRAERLGDPVFRRQVTDRAINQLIAAWKPLRTAREVLRSSPGILGGALDVMLGAKRFTPMGRLISTVVTALTPLLMEKAGIRRKGEEVNLPLGEAVRREFGVSWQRLKDHLRDRLEARRTDQAGTPQEKVSP